MRIHEILSPERTLSATARFRETFKQFRQAYPGIDRMLREFIEFRLSHRSEEPFGAKDTPFTGTVLRGFRHFHMVHGRVILIYQLTSIELRLCLVMDHSYSTQHGKTTLSAYLNSSNTTYQPIADTRKVLSKDQVQTISELFFEYAAHDRRGLQRTSDGDLAELMEFVRLVLDVPWTAQEKDQATLAAFGGVEGLRAAVKRVLQQTAVRSAVAAE